MIHSILLILSVAYVYFSSRDLFTEISTEFQRGSFPFHQRILNSAKVFLHGVIHCGKCFTFWAGLALTMNVIPAAIASMVFDLYERVKLKLF